MTPILLSLLAACFRPAPPVAADASTPVVLATALDAFDDATVTDLPKRLDEALREELTRRNLTVSAPDPSIYTAFTERRSIESRIAWLGGDATRPTLLVACAPRFSAQVNGRYRWSVEVDVSMTGMPSQSFTVPVHLLYAHEDEDEAAIDAAPIIASRVGRMLDEWLAAQKVQPPK